MKIGVALGTPPDPPRVWIDFAFFAKEAERLGFESVWIGEHVTSPVHCESFSPTFANGQVPGFFDPMVAFGRASAVTNQVKLGTGVTLVPEHHPLRLAKAIATLDHLSGGRVLFGVGPGWNREERAMMGGEMQRPWAQTREAVLAMKELWTQEEVAFQGEFYSFPAVRSFPRPRSKPHPPVYLSGVSPALVRRMVDWGDGWVGFRTTPAELEGRMRELRELAPLAGRDPDEFEISMYTWEPSRDLARQYEETGARRLIVQTAALSEERQTVERLEQIAEIVGL
ncbi:TIGR03619 family F420-dependent LLM class oxidoreductase [Myxococcota bacterium]|nr:TIGR03619 family F420-dependent LLM class oxidoreductase [Myxococcota bacterium]